MELLHPSADDGQVVAPVVETTHLLKPRLSVPFHDVVIQVAFHSELAFGFRLRIQIVMAGRKRSSGRNAPSGVDTVVHELNSNHKETISLVLD